MNITSFYKTELYSDCYYKSFLGLYNNFKESAFKDYKFELEPLDYKSFIESIKKGLINCILLLEDDIPTGFLAYTTIISEAIELNIIHCIGTQNLNQKRSLLLEKFIEINKNLMKEKIVTYPMLGKQSAFASNISAYGFKTVNTTVFHLNLLDPLLANKINNIQTKKLDDNFSITNWNSSYFKIAPEVILQSFKDSSDALFDCRFTTYNGCCDIVHKITENIYGLFLPEVSKILLHKNQPVGFCFANLTNDKIANIPVTAILKKYRGNCFSIILIKNLLSDLLNYSIVNGNTPIELNVSCDSDNIPAVRMYSSTGFTKDYSYPTAYHPGFA